MKYKTTIEKQSCFGLSGDWGLRSHAFLWDLYGYTGAQRKSWKNTDSFKYSVWKK